MAIDYTSNSHKSKGIVSPEPKHVEKIVSGEVKRQKKPLGRKMRDIFIAVDIKSVFAYVGQNVLIPAARNMVVDASSRGIERLMYGEAAARRPGQSNGVKIQYNSPVSRPDPRMVSGGMPRASSVHERSAAARFDYILTTRNEADRVLMQMSDIASTYGCVSVADLHQMLGYEVTHVDNKWGWEYMGHAHVTQVREGFLLNLPPVTEI